MKKSDLRKNLG